MAVALPLIGGLAGAGLASLAFPGVALAPSIGYFIGSMLASLLVPGSVPTGDPPKKASISDIQFNKTEEGSPVPLVYGTCRVTPNIIWFGNLHTEKIKRKVKAGKKSKKVTVGYKYYLDVWFAICQGKTELVKVFRGDKTEDLSKHCDWYLWCEEPPHNLFPDEQRPYVNNLPGITHCFIRRLYLGQNTTYVPTLQFVVKRVFGAMPVDWDMPSGTNPAAVMYDLLVNQAGLNPSYVDVDSFKALASEYAARNWGLNIQVTGNTDIGRFLERVANYVDTVLVSDDSGRVQLRLFRDDDSAIATIDNDFKSLTLTKPSWTTVGATFKGDFVDQDNNFKVRGIGVRNQANMAMTGQEKIVPVDVSAFGSRDAAFERLFTAMKRYSYPTATIEATLPLRWAWLKPGDVVNVKHDLYEINGPFRIINAKVMPLDKNEVQVSMRQHTGELFDDNYVVGPPSLGGELDMTLEPLSKVAVFEVPYLKGIGSGPLYLILASRETGWETGFNIYVSYDGTSYEFYGACSTFAQYGTLLEDLPVGYPVDDANVLKYQPYKEYEDYGQLDRDAIWASTRACIVEGEAMLFGEHEPATNGWEIRHLRRGITWTDVAAHSAGAPVWVYEVDDNLVEIDASEFWVKLVPTSGDGEGDISQATAIHVVCTRKGATPQKPALIEATRTGEQVHVKWWPITYLYDGAGDAPADAYTDRWPPDVEGDFEYTIDGTAWTATSGVEVTITNSGAFTFQVRHRWNGRTGPARSLQIGTNDGTYRG